jgi:hypothetical protein
MDEQEHLLTESLKKASSIVGTIDERYREVAFPIILQSLIDGQAQVDDKNIPTQGTNTQKTSGSQFLPGMSVNEFFRKVGPSSHPERFVCAAYYLLNVSNVDRFTVADILDIYGKLRQPKPGNPSDIIYKCIRKAHLVDAPATNDKQKHWAITPEGEKFVESLLNGSTTGNK